MAFKLNVTTNTQTSGGERKEVDWDKLNQHVIDAAGTANKARSIPGIISGIIDLGEQNREDAEIEFKGTPEEEEAIKAEKPNTYFENDRDGKRVMRYPQKPVQQIAITVDFPQITVDKGQFFGNSNPQPLRMLLNGEFTLSEGTRVVARPFSIVESKHDIGGGKSTWAFAKNSMLHKLAEATEILDANKLFRKDNVGELLGKAALFQFRCYMKPSKKDPSKSYFTEEIKLAGLIPEGLEAPAFDEAILYGVNLFGENAEADVKQLRASVRNTIERANNYEQSDLKALFDANAPQGQQTTKSDDTPPVLTPADGPEPDLDKDTPF